MKGTYSALMQSKFFNPAFNSAIFDGPLRVYFSQSHESLALKIYFTLQQRFANELARAKEVHKFVERTTLVMIYPNQESFSHSFDSETFMKTEHLSDDTIIGINGPFEDAQLDQVLGQILTAFQEWEKIPYEKASAGAIL